MLSPPNNYESKIVRVIMDYSPLEEILNYGIFLHFVPLNRQK